MDKVLPWIGQPLPAIPTDTLASLTTTLRGLFGHFGGDLQRFRAVGLHCKLSQVDRMCTAKDATASPSNLLTTIYHLRLIRDDSPLVATIALNKWKKHLNWISPELAIFAIFNKNTPVEERQALANELYSCKEDWVPGELPIAAMATPGPNFPTNDLFWHRGEPPSLVTFITFRSFLLWEVMSHDHSKLVWLTRDTTEWEEFDDYRELHFLSNNMMVVNDPAERIVQLAEDRMKSARSEAMFQDTVLFVDEMQRLADGFKRGNFSKAKLQGVIQRLLAGTELDT